MGNVRILEVKQSIFESNDKQAALLREELKKDGVFLLNLMSSPGSGKTTTLTRTIEALKDDLKIGVMEADIDSDVDAETILKTGAKAIQLHTGGMCHLDADMTRQGLKGLGTDDVELVILENVGMSSRVRYGCSEKCNDLIRTGRTRQTFKISADVFYL